MGKLFGTAAVALALTVGAAPEAPAMAAQLLFTISGDDPTITFVLPEDPTPRSVSPGSFFAIGSTPAVVGGSPSTLVYILFYKVTGSGDYNIQYEIGSDTFLYEGPQMYAGTEEHPMFSPSGPFLMSSVLVPGVVDHLTISEVPEPSTWAMMALGFAGLGFARYRTSRRTAPAA
jgi:hypothetical protein